MQIYDKRAWKSNVPYELKKEFFLKFRDLCCYYGVHIYDGEIEFPKNLKNENDPDMIPAIFFEFYDGTTYTWCDGEIEYANCNSFTNCDNENDVITINGINFQINGKNEDERGN